MDPVRRIQELLDSHGMVLVRTKKHKVYRHPDGWTFVMASTSVSMDGIQNALKILERRLGLRVRNKELDPRPRRKYQPKQRQVQKLRFEPLTSTAPRTLRSELQHLKESA